MALVQRKNADDEFDKPIQRGVQRFKSTDGRVRGVQIEHKRAAANDSNWEAANDDVYEEEEDKNKATQYRVAGGAVKTTASGMKGAAAALQTTGAVAESAGKTGKKVSQKVTKAGQKLTKSKAGAVVGAPVMAAGMVGEGASAVAETGGRVAQKGAGYMKKAAKRVDKEAEDLNTMANLEERRQQPRGLLENDDASGITTDEAFRASYPKRGLQPSVGGIFEDQNKDFDWSNPHQRRDAKGRAVDGKRNKADSTRQAAAFGKRKLKKGKGESKINQDKKRGIKRGKQAGAKKQPAKTPFVPPAYRKSRTIMNKLNKKSGSVEENKARVEAAKVSITITGWVTGSYIFHLFCSLAYLFFLGLTYLYFEAVNVLSGNTGGEGDSVFRFVFGWIGGIARSVGSFISKIGDAFGIDFTINIVTPDDVLLFFHFLIMAYGFGLIAAAAVQYKRKGIKTFFGEGSTLKQGALLLCFVAYSLPITNLFIPWIFLWMAAVTAKPK